MTDKILVLTTTGSKAEAGKIARALVEGQLAACVNVVPGLTSVFRWEGKVEESEECLLVIKTVEEKFGSVRDAIAKLHSYDLPECIAIPITEGSPEYLKWIEKSLQP